MQKANDSPVIPLASASGVGSPPYSTGSTDFGSWRMLSMSTYTPSEHFTVSEKVELLVNILSTLVPDLPAYLLNLIFVDLQRQPQWMDIALPKGRTLHACQIAFEEMRKSMAQQSGPVARSFHPSTSYVNIAPAVAPGRSVPESDPLIATRRPLQPRPIVRATESPNPPVTNGESPIYTRGSILEPATEPSKKRGRPTKAQVAERDQQYAARGQTYQPKKRPSKRIRQSVGPDAPELKDEESTTPLLQTPSARVSTPTEETSSGKRRSRRQGKDLSPIRTPSAGAGTSRWDSGQGQQPEQEQEQEQEQDPETNVAESPSDRLLASHRDRDRGSVGSSLSRRTQQESDTLESGHLESDFPPT